LRRAGFWPARCFAMKSALVGLTKRAGVDRAIGYTLLSRGWTVLSGPLNLFFVISFLSKTEQGFYYAFASVLGLQIFFELGLGLVVLQFVSHEKAFLDWTPQGTLEPCADVSPEEGARAKARLASLVRLVTHWYGAVSLGFALVVPVVGWIFFMRHPQPGAPIAWVAPWLFISVVEAGNLLSSPYFAIVDGCGLIPQTAFMRLQQNVLSSFVFWVVLGSGAGLWGATVAGAMGLVWNWGWLALTKRALFLDLWRASREKASSETRVDWKREIWPLQWKIALSWLSSYFIFSLFTPVTFAFSGAAAAGQVGMSITIATAIWTMAFSWLGTKAAPFGTLAAGKNWRALDAAFFPALWQSTILVAVGATLFWALAFLLHAVGHRFGSRILEPLPLAFLLAATLVNHVVAGLGLYLRAHKEEPFLWLSLVSGVLVGLSTYLFGRFIGSTGMMGGYFLISLCVGLGWGSQIFNQKRRQWHSADEPREAVTVAP